MEVETYNVASYLDASLGLNRLLYIPKVEWFHYSPFQYVIFTAIDFALSPIVNHGLIR